ncbi:heavy metal translocating P-type ATPase [Nocardia vaccinii]|uniref:heavy metal translocating P-type ATPase n=1 Tax=Nocardia vaccinii TaxID=1822 RepID=UPI00082B942D|nr:heavy metal translocating P-type ATPase [Nocardia vaccinii]
MSQVTTAVRPWLNRSAWWAQPLLVAVTVTGLVVGGILWLAGIRDAADVAWAATTVVALVPAVFWMMATFAKGRAGVDLIAVLSLAGTILVHEYLAGALIAVMLAGGRSLDAAAEGRAARDLRALLERAPRSARRRDGEQVTVIAADDVAVGDVLVVAAGEAVPVDGRITNTGAVLDESALTGEPRQVERRCGEPVRSGVVNVGAVFEMCAGATAPDSTYAGIVRLAEQAGAESAPVVRLANRYAAWFLPLALLVAAAAYGVSGSAVRAVAVLVVATPCPLLLAVPVAIVSGLSRAARTGVLARGGDALETIGHATTLVMDKTGTLTAGRPRVVEVVAAPGRDVTAILRSAASVDRMSPHVLAEAIVTEALARGLDPTAPPDIVEQAGRGVSGTVDGRHVEVGKLPDAMLTGAGWARAVVNRAGLDPAAIAWVVIDGELAGAILLRDPLLRHAPGIVRRLRRAGLRRLVMLTGDRPEPAREVATVMGLDEVYAGQSPADKVAVVRREREHAVTVMVGDGVNDAPALDAATVGVAIRAHGASCDAADIVLTTDRLDRLADAMDTARWSRRIAVQSAAAGTGLSLLAMIIAALGLLPPAAGALLQECIDVAAILNALRALRGHPRTRVELPAATEESLHRFAGEYDMLRDTLTLLRAAADELAERPHEAAALTAVRAAHRFLVEQLLPHEQAEETQLYPAFAGPLGSAEATATMSRTHAEIQRLTTRIGTYVDLADGIGHLAPEQTDDLLACLYGLHTLLRLHFVEEEENYFTLTGEDLEPNSATTVSGTARSRRR